jgi:dipeptidyl aminopeptidase/acylaminoacyl peptidase
MAILSSLVLLTSARQSAFQAGPNPMLMQHPTINRTTIVFEYAGDLWSVPREGGDAKRLTSSPGIETSPYFSPDGSTIAFTGQYHGNSDVFTIPVEGGIPKRLTYHPAAKIVMGWTPDGKNILFSSTMMSNTEFQSNSRSRWGQWHRSRLTGKGLLMYPVSSGRMLGSDIVAVRRTQFGLAK